METGMFSLEMFSITRLSFRFAGGEEKSPMKQAAPPDKNG